MTSDDDALMQTIIENPDDDAPRLVYADWLEEHGSTAHAELIRVQIELSRVSFHDRRFDKLSAREAELLAEPKEALDQRMRRFVEAIGVSELTKRLKQISRFGYRRGLLESVTLHCAALLDWAEDLFAIGPITFLHISAARGRCASLARLPQMARIVHLNLSSTGLGTRDIVPLANSPCLGRLRNLDLSHNKIGDAAAQALVDSIALRNLRPLDLRDNPIGYRLLPKLRERFGERVLLPEPGFFP